MVPQFDAEERVGKLPQDLARSQGRRHGPRFPGKAGAFAAAILVAAISAALVPGAAIAFGGPRPHASLGLAAPATSVVGQNVTTVATFSGGSRGFAGGQPVTLFVDGSFISTRFTDSGGRASFTISGSVLNVARTYLLKAFAGGRHGGVSASSQLAVTAAPLAVSGGRTGTIALRTSVSLSIPTGSPLGADVTVGAVLKDAAGRAVFGQRIALMLDGTQIKSDDTGPGGLVSFLIPGHKLDQARAYTVQAVFSGSHGYLASAVTSTLTVLSAAIEIRTVPALPGVAFSMGGIEAVTGPDGVAALPVPASGTYKLLTNLNPDAAGTPGVRASFVRWADDVFTPDRNIVVDGPATYVIGLRIADTARIRYVDLAGRTVDPTLVEDTRFVAADGTELALNTQTGAGEFWLTTSTSTPGPGNGLTFSPVIYKAVSARIHGLEALAPGQQSWTPSHGGTWTIRLALYDLSVRPEDAISGASVGGRLHLELPDGTTVEKPVGADGTATFADLPAGQYRVSLDSSLPGMAVSLPASQVQTMHVVTLWDVIALIGAWFGFVLVMLFAVLGRRLPLVQRLPRLPRLPRLRRV
jgi:hypothetical protein